MYEMQTFDNILERMLERVPDSFDKREGSIIYDALAPAALELSNAYIELDNVIANTFPSTCDREFLLQFAAEKGMTPIAATPAVIKLVTTPTWVDVPLGSVMSIGNFNYTVTSKIADGEYEATCDTPGEAGGVISNDMTVVPILEITDLESIEFDSVLDEGTDEEDTEHLRARYIESLKPFAFGGNVADYKAKTLSIEGVGAVKVLRATPAGGFVSVLILDNSLDVASQSLVEKVQEVLDPNPGAGEGLAPIGHVVTVGTVTDADITVTVQLASDTPIDDATIRSVIEQYFLSLRKTWETSEGGIVVRRSQIEDDILTLNGVIDVQVTELKLTGSSDTSHSLTLNTDKVPRLDVLTVVPAN